VACGQYFPLFFKLTRIGCRMFWSTETSVSCNNLFMTATHNHAESTSSPTHLKLIGGGRNPRDSACKLQIPLDLRHLRTQGLGPQNLG
jgi:hypothetical protein